MKKLKIWQWALIIAGIIAVIYFFIGPAMKKGNAVNQAARKESIDNTVTWLLAQPDDQPWRAMILEKIAANGKTFKEQARIEATWNYDHNMI